jgi:hypothetical protein
MLRTWQAAWRLSWQMAETTLAAATTVTLRSAAIGAALARGRLPPAAETARMLAEKPAAAVEAAAALARSALAPGRPSPARALAAAEAALRPVRRRTRANAKRLSKR